MDCVDLEKDFYLIRFGLVEDYDDVLKGGPWFVGGHFLNIRVWEPNFKPTLAVCNMVAVWIRLPELPIEFYALCVLKELEVRLDRCYGLTPTLPQKQGVVMPGFVSKLISTNLLFDKSFWKGRFKISSMKGSILSTSPVGK